MTPDDYKRRDGYVSLTYPYTLPEEAEEFYRAVAQLKKGNRDYLIYECEDTAEIYIRQPCDSTPPTSRHDAR